VFYIRAQVKATGNQGKNEALAWIKGLSKEKPMSACAGSQSWMCVARIILQFSFFAPFFLKLFHVPHSRAQLYKQGQNRDAAAVGHAPLHQRRPAAAATLLCKPAAAAALSLR